MERLREILDTLRTGKLRAALTALSVAWGIFMLVLLLGAGSGIQNGVEHNFKDDATNSIWVYGGTTSQSHAGFGTGRRIQFDDEDYDAIEAAVPEIVHMTGRFYLSGEFTVKAGQTTSSFQVRATHPGHQYIENTIIVDGRFLNDLDLEHRRKVAVIGPKVVDILFGKKPAMGEWIEINGTPYRIVGLFDDAGWDSEKSLIYIPITTARVAYAGGTEIHQIMFTIDGEDIDGSRAIAEDLKRLLAARHQFSPEDPSAVRIRNNLEGYERLLSLFTAIRTFIWMVGIGTIIAGIVGVSNIMLISVRERTREIGIRKALGATPFNIVSQIVLEALIMTGLSGYVGLLAGLGLLEVVRAYVPPSDVFRDPQVDLGVVVGATALLVVSGVLAGYFPARIAAKIQPVEALRAE